MCHGLVHVRVIDERPGPRRRESRLERVTRGDERRYATSQAAESRRTIVVAVELNAVPVHRRWLAQVIDHHDRDGLSALEDNGRAEARTGARCGLPAGSFLEEEPHRRCG